MKLHLVDGTYELFRHHFALPSALAADGMEVAATRGLLRSMLAMLRDDDVTHVAIAFDHVIESFRNALFAGYKTGAGIDADLMAQFPLAEEVSQALGLVVWPMVDFEADDAMASAARKFAADGAVDQILLCSRDKDLAQCVSGRRIVMLDRMSGQTIDEGQVVEKFGVSPASIPDYLALVGDAADGWGAKSTATVLAAYGTIDAIPADEAAWSVSVRGAKSLAANLRERPREAALYKRLATLRTDVALPQSLDDLRWRGAHRKQLSAICGRIGDSRFIDRVHAFVD